MINRFNFDQAAQNQEKTQHTKQAPQNSENEHLYNQFPPVLQTTINNIIHGLAQKEQDYTPEQLKKNFVRNSDALSQEQLNYFVGNMMTFIAISDEHPDQKLDVDKNFISFLIQLFY